MAMAAETSEKPLLGEESEATVAIFIVFCPGECRQLSEENSLRAHEVILTILLFRGMNALNRLLAKKATEEGKA